MAVNLEGRVDLNVFLEQAGKAARGLAPNTAMVYNDSGKLVRFACYNAGDVLLTTPFANVAIANGCCGLVMAGGNPFKVYPDNKSGTQMLLAPKTAYRFRGVGDIAVVKPK